MGNLEGMKRKLLPILQQVVKEITVEKLMLGREKVLKNKKGRTFGDSGAAAISLIDGTRRDSTRRSN